MICGIPVVASSAKTVAASLRQGSGGGWVVTLNLEMIGRLLRDPAYRRLVASADVVVADGHAVLLLARAFERTRLPERITGVDLSAQLLRAGGFAKVAVLGHRSALLALRAIGGERLAEAALILDERFSVAPEQLEHTANRIREYGADVVFVALGVPKQDVYAAFLRDRLPGVRILGVGGTFDLLSGEKRRAPRWMGNWGLEWLFRLLQEPRRLWRRYLIDYPVALLAVARHYAARSRKRGA
jgi:N-acetylglucosaminyldiphosphoundecaprenol N-acetyl-beta-D-mannosaminyltransferase